MKPGLYDGVDYYAHPGSLSYSSAKVLLKAPALYQWRRSRPEPATDAMDFGSAVHTLTLGTGHPIRSVAAASWQGAPAKLARTEARASGEIPLLFRDLPRAARMAHKVQTHRLAKRLVFGRPEVLAVATDAATGVTRRAWIDNLTDAVAVDLKTTTAVDPWELANTVARYDYAMQAAWTLDLLADLGHPAQAFAFVFVSKEPPHFVTVAELDEDAIAVGRARNNRALQVYADCEAAGVWPGPVPDDEFVTLTLPRWYQEPAHV